MVDETNLGGRNSMRAKQQRRKAVRSNAADESVASQRTAIRLATRETGISFNTLSPIGKQAALSLLDQRVVTIEKRGEELVVERRKPRLWLSAMTIGLVPK